jgi:STAS-like domain of unknown function (DUF4325)
MVDLSTSLRRDIDIGTEFTRFPAGRYVADGHFSGEKFRDTVLIPALRAYREVRVFLDSTMGYGSSFLEEAFGGLVRADFEKQDLLRRLLLVSNDKSLVEEIQEYITKA